MSCGGNDHAHAREEGCGGACVCVCVCVCVLSVIGTRERRFTQQLYILTRNTTQRCSAVLPSSLLLIARSGSLTPFK